MPYRSIAFTNSNFYHIFNRGVEKRKIFSSNEDYERFLEAMYYYQFDGPKPKLSIHKRFRLVEFYKNPKIVDIICYCLMPNHFHLLIKQLRDKGTQDFIRKLLNSYTKYFNTKYDRDGHLFQGAFKAVTVDTDNQLLHLSRYIHLNPLVSKITNTLETYKYSSYPFYIGFGNNKLSTEKPLMSFFNSAKEYRKFVEDQRDYGTELEQVKHLLIEKD